MSAVEAQRLAAAHAAIVARSPRGVLIRRVAVAYLVALVTAPPVTAGALFLAGRWDAEPVAPAPVWRVVSSQCEDGRIQQGIDTGRPDGLLLASDTGVSC